MATMGLVMFRMVTATGIRVLAGVNLEKNPKNLLIIAISISVGLIPLVAKYFFSQMPHFVEPLLHSGILLTSVTAVALNFYFNGMRAGRHTFEPVHAADGTH